MLISLIWRNNNLIKGERSAAFISSLVHASHNNEDLMKNSYSNRPSSKPSLHLLILGLYFVCALRPFISNYVGTLPIWLQFALLKSLLKNKIPFPESSFLDDFLPLTKGSTVVLGHSYGCSISFLFELVQGLRELRGVTSA